MGAVMSLMSGACSGDDMPVKSDVSINLITDRAVYLPDESIDMSINISNHLGKPLILSFSNAQRFDFILEKDGRVLWTWSEGMMFAQVMGQEVLNAGQQITYNARFQDNLIPGTYKLTGKIVSINVPLSASATIVIQ